MDDNILRYTLRVTARFFRNSDMLPTMKVVPQIVKLSSI